MEGYHLFRDRYPELRRPIAHNVYAVSRNESLIDFKTYKAIMAASGLDFSDVSPEQYGLVNCEGAIETPEEYVDVTTARAYFEGHLGPSLHLQEPVDIGELARSRAFHYIIDCTWGHAQTMADVYYEPCLLLYYRDLHQRFQDMAITLVDGDLCSLYPTDTPTVYTLSSVPHTPLGRCATSSEAEARLLEVDACEVDLKRQLFEAQMNSYLPGFTEGLEFIGPQLSVKTKPLSASADRSCRVWSDEAVITVLSGKIDTIFHAFDRVVSLIEA